MKVAVVSNDVVPGMGLPCSGQGIRAFGTARLFGIAGAEADVVMDEAMVLQRLSRWKAPRIALPPSARVVRSTDTQRVLADYDLIVVHNWAAAGPLEDIKLPPLVYDFFSATLVEHEFFGRGDAYMKDIRTRKRAVVARAGLIWANGPGRAEYAREFLREMNGEGPGADVLDVPMCPPPAPPRPRRVVTLGGFHQAWAAGLNSDLVDRIASALPDHEIAILGGGEHYHFQQPAVPERGTCAVNARRIAPLNYADYAAIIGMSRAFVDVAPLNAERRLSFSSRGMVAIALGCPIVHNSETDLGRLVASYGAGVAVPATADGGLDTDRIVRATVDCVREERGESCENLRSTLERTSLDGVKATLRWLKNA